MDKTKKPSVYSLIPLVMIAISMIAVLTHSFFADWTLQDYIRLHQELQQFHEKHPLSTPLIFIGIYFVCTLLSIPGIFLLSLLAGYLFSQPYSTLYVLFASTVGSCFLFLMTRSALGYLFYKLPERYLKKMERGFHKHAANYLLCLRLVPLFPFWVVNIAGALFNVSFFTFFWTTLLGMIPSVYLFTESGKGLEALLQAHANFDLGDLFYSQLGRGFIGLALLSILPLFFKQANAHPKENIEYEYSEKQ